jgi:xanthine/CO dehydrogenase XdhC/CoxF family maturation factor
MADVEHWYALTLCRKEADCLYKRTLDGLWAMIKASEHKEELCKRLKEELTESVGMCCEGHLSRLCNVLVGFDDAFTTVISKGELLQKKMSEIAALEVTTRTKKMRAKAVLKELAIPVAEHSAWLDAF